MKIAVLSCINDFQSAYSIATMTEAKLKAFHLLGLDKDMVYVKPEDGPTPEFWEGEVRGFKEMIPLKNWYDEEVDDSFFSLLEPITESMVKALFDVDAVIVEDMLLQGWYLPYLMGIRTAEKANPKMKVYFNNHSCPSPRRNFSFPKDELMRITEQEFILYNNNSDIPQEERMYNAYGRVLAIFNPIDIPKFNRFTKEAEDFYYEYKLYEKDIISVYPSRVSTGKQFHKWLAALRGFKSIGANTFGIIADSYGTGVKEGELKEELKVLGEKIGFKYGEDWVYTSEAIPTCELFCPQPILSSLMSVANLFIQTSISETYSLIMLESMANKQHIILNEDLRYILTQEVGAFCQKAKFSSLLFNTAYKPSFEAYCEDLARATIKNMRGQESQKGFIWASKNNNLIRYGRRLLSIIGKEEFLEDMSCILLDETDIEKPAPPDFLGGKSGKVKIG